MNKKKKPVKAILIGVLSTLIIGGAIGTYAYFDPEFDGLNDSKTEEKKEESRTDGTTLSVANLKTIKEDSNTTLTNLEKEVGDFKKDSNTVNIKNKLTTVESYVDESIPKDSLIYQEVSQIMERVKYYVKEYLSDLNNQGTETINVIKKAFTKLKEVIEKAFTQTIDAKENNKTLEPKKEVKEEVPGSDNPDFIIRQVDREVRRYFNIPQLSQTRKDNINIELDKLEQIIIKYDTKLSPLAYDDLYKTLNETRNDVNNSDVDSFKLKFAFLIESLNNAYKQFNDDKETPVTNPQPKIEEGTNWKITEEFDSTDSSKSKKTLRIKEGSTSIVAAKQELDSLVIDITNIDNIEVPFKLGANEIKNSTEKQSKKEEVFGLIKKDLGLSTNYDNSKIGFVLHKTDYDENGSYFNLDLVEVNIPVSTQTISSFQFQRNRIKKVNWDELTKLEEIKSDSFAENLLEGDLDLSKLVKLKLIGRHVFGNNLFTGKLTLPESIETIGEGAFNRILPDVANNNKFSGTLTLPKNLKTIEREAFFSNSFTKLEWSGAENLETIGEFAFRSNKLTSLDFANTPPKLNEIKFQAFQNNDGPLIKSDTTLPYSLRSIRSGAISVKPGITIHVAKGTGNISEGSFEIIGEGSITIKKDVTS